MGFADDYYYDDYSSYGDPYAESAYYSQPEATYQEVYTPPVQWPTVSDADLYYQAPPSTDQGGSYVPDWLTTAGKNLKDYAVANPKDVLGMGIGAGMGLYGMFTSPDKQPAPDLRASQAANEALRAQLASTQGLNAAAVAKLQGQIAGDYGDYADAARARQTATAEVQRLMDQGPDYSLQPEEERQIAALAQKWSGKGMLGSSMHNKELQDLKATFTNNAQQRWRDQIAALQGISNAQSGQTSTQFQQTGNVVNTGQQQQIQGLSDIAQSGLQGAQLKSNVDTANNKLQQERSNQLLTTGGQIFGRSFSNPAEDLAKAQSIYKKSAGYTAV